jgi:hypothetical protein
LKKVVNFTNGQQESGFLRQIRTFQNFLSPYTITKDQHLGFEAAA